MATMPETVTFRVRNILTVRLVALAASFLGLLLSRKFQYAVLTLIVLYYAPRLGLDPWAVLGVFGVAVTGHTVTDVVRGGATGAGSETPGA